MILDIGILILEMVLLCLNYGSLKGKTKLELASIFVTCLLKLFFMYIAIAVLLKLVLHFGFYQSLYNMFFGSVKYILKFHAIATAFIVLMFFLPKVMELDVDILKVEKKKNVLFSSFFLFFAVQFTSLFFYMRMFFPGLDVDQLFFTLFAPAIGMSNAIFNASIIMLILFPTIAVVLNLIFHKLGLKIAFHFSIKVQEVLPITIRKKLIPSLILAAFALLVVFIRFPIIEFIKRELAPYSSFYETYYIDPKGVNFKFPEKKKNLIFIYVESMEAEGVGNILKGVDLIPELGKLAKENLSFSHNDGIGGPLQVPGTNNSISSCCNTHVGLPLIMWVYGDFNRYSNKLFSGAYGLGNILSNGGGYITSYVVGSVKGSFGMDTFFESHGFPLKGLEYWYQIGKVPNDYYVQFGVEDKKLVEYAKEEILTLAKQNKPFAFSMFFEDTHFPNGYVCEECEKKHVRSIHNVYECTSRRVGRFVQWIKEQAFYEDTLIVILGDHLYSGDDLYGDERSGLYLNHNRHAYNVFINTKDYSKFSKNRSYCTFDYFPTIIDLLDIEYDAPGLGIGRSLVKGGKTLLEELGEEKMASEMVKKNKLYRKLLVE